MPFPRKLHECFSSFAYDQPSAPAVITDERVLTYAQLDAVSDTLALELQYRGIVTQEAIGVLVERSADLPTAFLAILKAGGVYVPMVANLPAERLANMAEQADLRRLIVLDGMEPPAELIKALIANGASDAPAAIIRPESLPTERQEGTLLPIQTGGITDLAAILFTSGSTGTPKGVMLQHDSCANMVLGHMAAHHITNQDRVLLSASPGFILGFRESCLPFMCGAAFVPVTRAIIDQPDQLLALMSRHRVSIAMFTPSYLRLLNGGVPQGLRCIITAGERPNSDDARHYAKYLDYWAVYGATEACGTIFMNHVDPNGEGPLPGGQPFANTDVHLLDSDGNDVPQGEVGEIHAIGVSISRGYLKQPELTAQSFVKTRYGRAFRTNDLARWNSNGELETLGRADDVIKVSGQRVSLGEIESTLLRHPDVRRAAALHLKGMLVACVECPEPEQAQSVDWRAFLSSSLPSYMVPAQVAVLPKMPISSAGKLDRKALLEIADSVFQDMRNQEGGTAPQGELEIVIAGIWEELLDIRPIRRENNFFAIGGTSLLAIAVSQRLQALGHDITVQMVLTALTVESLATQLAGTRKQQPLINDEATEENIATVDQNGFHIASEIGLPPAASHVVRIMAVRGRLPGPEEWQTAWFSLLSHHPALRSGFYQDKDSSLCWRTVEALELPPHARLMFEHCASLEKAREKIAYWTNEKFPLSDPPLVRAGLITVAEGGEPLFWAVLHHSVVDGISARLLLEDLLTLLGNRTLPPTLHGVAIAGIAEQRYLKSDRFKHDREFWLNKFDRLAKQGNEAFQEYLTEHPRPSLPGGQGATPLVEHLDATTVEALSLLAKKHGTGLHALLLAILTLVIRRRSGKKDVIIGSGISIRPTGGETALGHFVNILPVLIRHKKETRFSEFLHSSQAALTETVRHAEFPSAILNREFRQRHPDLLPQLRTSLFGIALTAIPSRFCRDQETGLTLEPYHLPGGLEYPAAGLDLQFSHEPCLEEGGGLNLHLIRNPDICSMKVAAAWLAALADWARWLAEEPERCEQPLPKLLPHETALLERWERGAEIKRPHQCSHRIFEALVDRHPQKLAVAGRDGNQTFAQLDSRANGIALKLIRQGAARGTTVAVLTAASVDLPAAVLGIWKAGATYLPLPAELPPARLAAMVLDSDVKILIALDGLLAPETLVESVSDIIRLEDCPPTGQRPSMPDFPDDIAYIIYTSGTTGTPKGVPVRHSSYINIILGVAETVGFLPDDRISLVATVGFDASLWELGHGLLNGITIVPVSQELRDDPWQLKRYYQELGVTVAFHTPSYLRISEQLPFTGLRHLFTGGEAPTHRDLQQHAGQTAFWNFYGPTEATIVVSTARIHTDHPAEAPLPIGGPFPNLLISLRRDDGSVVPPGVQGELWLGGSGITPGYLNRPDLSAKSFVTTPEGRFYRSGDYGRWNENGQIELSGRIDQQVKLNGQRVELGEIEQTFCRHPSIADAVVLIEELSSGAKVLRAFIRPIDATPSEALLTEFISAQLPAHMLPASITPVNTIPLTPSGKVDRRALLSNYTEQLNKSSANEAPQDPLEMRIAAIWSDLLGVSVNRNDNFFALGGNSLLAITMTHRLSEQLGQRVSARTLFSAPILATFVSAIKLLIAAQEPVAPAAATGLATDQATVGEREFWTAESAGLDTRTFTIPVQYLVNRTIEPEHLQAAWSALVDRHEALRTCFEEDETGRLRRSIAADVAVSIETAKVTDRSAALAHIRQRQADSISMAVAPLWRLGLVTAQQDNAQFFWLALHHSVGDGQSIGTLLNELTILLADGSLSPPGGAASLFASREELYFTTTDSILDAQYWLDLLQSLPTAAFAEWPLDQARSPQIPSGNHRLVIALDRQAHEALKSVARNHDSSFHALMLTLFALEAGRRSGRADVLIGTTASIRESLSDTEIIGFGVNMLPLHLKPSLAECFGDLLRTTQSNLAEALQHARQPFAHIYRSFWNERPELRNPQRYPLFDIAATENPVTGNTGATQRFRRASVATEKISYERTEASPGQDMVLIHEGLSSGEFLLQLQLNAAIYSEKTARSWFEALIGWARWLAENPAHARQPLPRLLPQEQLQLAQWEQGETIARPPVRFHELFESVVDQAGQANAPAILTSENTVTYRALEEQANAIAHSLLQRGVEPGSVIAVLTGRSANLPAAVLGIWKAGAIYLPLAAELPADRLAFMLRDAAVSQLIALDAVSIPAALADQLPEALRPEELSPEFSQAYATRPYLPGEASDVAYILYTSGSTGEPKGTLIGHDSYVNLVLGAIEAYRLTADDRCLMFASPSFDVSLSDMGVPLACGAAICPVPLAVIESPQQFLDFMREQRITLADITPTYLRLFEGCDLPETVRILVTGGEPPTAADVATYSGKLSYFNAYGPTENCITSSMGILTGSRQDFLPAGRPLPNTTLQICDDEGHSLPPGVAGEIWLGGIGLSRGYLNRPELTKASFVETGQGRRYRSGDLGRWNKDGQLVILGRLDDQVKLSGIRIELGEIEHALTSHPAISQAVVLLAKQEQGSSSLWAFVRPATGASLPNDDAWRRHMAERLPSHMIPSGLIPLSVIPLSAAGKVDRAALLALLAKRPQTSGRTLPINDLERCVAEVWSDVLGWSPIHREDNFFELGGHSLLAITVAHRLEKLLGREVPARELFAEPTLSGFAERVGMLSVQEPDIDLSSDLATVGQREFWTAEQAGLDTTGFNIALTLAVQGELPAAERWQAAWSALITRHESLRTGFREDDCGILQREIVEQLNVPFEILEFSSPDEAFGFIGNRQQQPFNMAVAGLWRAGLVRIAENDQTIFWFVMHHSVGDGLSLGILTEELPALLQGHYPPLPEISFNRFAAREAAYLTGQASQADALYWQQVVADLGKQAPEAFDEWSLDKPRLSARTAGSSQGSHCLRLRLDRATATQLRALARRNGASLHALMLAIVGVEVHRRTGRSGFLLGTAASTRQSAAEAKTVGYFVNMLPLACLADQAGSIDTAIKAMQRELAEALQHSNYPFARIYSDYRREHPLPHHPARYPLFDFAVTENPVAGSTPETGVRFSPIATAELEAAEYTLRQSGPGQDMVLIHEGQPDGSLVLTWFVNAAIYTRDTTRSWFDALAGWMRFLADKHLAPGEPLPRLLPEEERLLQMYQNGPKRPLPFACFPDLFRQLAETEPQRPALLTDAGVQSYGVVNAASDALAQVLLECGLQRGEAVAVLTERSVALPEVVLAIWKAGACYLPLTADLPAERLAFMAKDAGIRILITLDRLPIPAELEAGRYRIIRPEESVPLTPKAPTTQSIPLTPDDPAYILYTSGSTGVPKGVVLRHGGMLNLGLGVAECLTLRSDDRTLIMSSPSFDLWISDLVMTWSVGAALVPVRREAMNDIAGMLDLIRRLGVTVATMSPSYLRMFERADLGPVRILMTVGEAPIPADAQYYAGKLLYFNGYGPTENTAGTSYSQVNTDTEQIAAGRPLPNMTVYILDNHGHPVPPGVTGELWISGMGVAQGYLNRPDLTAAAFLEINGERRYRTGDLGRWLHSGELQILGRSDTQVKLRGQRVELGEIEQRLAAYPGVQQAVAVIETTPDNNTILRAFVVCDQLAITPAQSEWSAYLSESLPSYMVPATVLRIGAVPLTAAGKVDRPALLALMANTDHAIDTEHLGMRTAPQNAIEKRIAHIWAERLGCQFVSREDNFFELGGDSLKAIAVISALRREFACRVNDLYEHPILADFAKLCRQQPDHLRQVIGNICHEWKRGSGLQVASQAERDEALRLPRAEYARRTSSEAGLDLTVSQSYRHVLLTGASGYLGSHLLRELLSDHDRHVTVVVRSADNRSARQRLGQVLVHYFGNTTGMALRDNQRLTVLAGDLRQTDLSLSQRDSGRLMETVDAIHHCAANVNHFGHYGDFQGDNITATRNLLSLASHSKPRPADFHFISTLSVAGKSSPDEFRLFTEYDLVPHAPDENYYIRSKQEGERLVLAARNELPNASIHRVGNVVFSTDSINLQHNMSNNAFFRQLSSFVQLGVVPLELHVSLCYVDVTARAIVALSNAKALANQIHHIEKAQLDLLADFIKTAEGMSEQVQACDFGGFLERLHEAIDEPQMEKAVAETVETFGISAGRSPLERLYRLAIASDRTQALLDKLGVNWPTIPPAGQNAMIQAALQGSAI